MDRERALRIGRGRYGQGVGVKDDRKSFLDLRGGQVGTRKERWGRGVGVMLLSE